ncbi:tumor necrosis factor alpha-induced protein 8 isoform X2 [Nematostella vectensis]|uniref:tumor necrosis factor alpha-induced protein 8 isoform X2 n=1 Tax=Nematostella vectensis TaxID=45351 RepID=UPI0013900520|nr:tumor necrosis factor alpha-induced protein 8 isoform X2 [Nematostella vectensis]
MEDEDNMADGGFNSKSVALRAQKKVLGKLSSKGMAKALVDDTTGDLLDQLYKLAKMEASSKKEAEKLIKDLIKIVVKISILFRNNQFNKEEIMLAEKFRKNFKSAAMTFISFYEVDFSFDRQFLSKSLCECQALLHQLIERHLTSKSHGRVDHVFNYFANGALLERLFDPNEQAFRVILKNMVDGLNKLMEDGSL